METFLIESHVLVHRSTNPSFRSPTRIWTRWPAFHHIGILHVGIDSVSSLNGSVILAQLQVKVSYHLFSSVWGFVVSAYTEIGIRYAGIVYSVVPNMQLQQGTVAFLSLFLHRSVFMSA